MALIVQSLFAFIFMRQIVSMFHTRCVFCALYSVAQKLCHRPLLIKKVTNILQGGGIFIDTITTHLWQGLMVTEFRKLVSIWQSYT